jgi:hypothetical protein
MGSRCSFRGPFGTGPAVPEKSSTPSEPAPRSHRPTRSGVAGVSSGPGSGMSQWPGATKGPVLADAVARQDVDVQARLDAAARGGHVPRVREGRTAVDQHPRGEVVEVLRSVLRDEFFLLGRADHRVEAGGLAGPLDAVAGHQLVGQRRVLAPHPAPGDHAFRVVRKLGHGPRIGPAGDTVLSEFPHRVGRSSPDRGPGGEPTSGGCPGLAPPLDDPLGDTVVPGVSPAGWGGPSAIGRPAGRHAAEPGRGRPAARTGRRDLRRKSVPRFSSTPAGRRRWVRA